MLYDTIIVGSGPAGLTASIYASRYKMTNLVVGLLPGGTITWASEVENFPGLPGISGVELGRRMLEQAKTLGGEFFFEEVGKVEGIEGNEGFEGKRFKIVTKSGKEFKAKTLIVATGTERRKLNVPGEKEHLGRGVSYCTNCDAPFFKNKTVALIGGSNAAVAGAIHLSEFAQKVYIIYRKSELRAEPVWVEETLKNSKIEVVYNTNLLRILGREGQGEQGGQEGQGRVGGVELDNPHEGEKILKVDGVFIEIGGVPVTGFLKEVGVEVDEEGYLKVSERMETNIGGVFAAGDVTDKSRILSQAITACGQGAIAAYSAFDYLKKNKKG